MKTILKTKIKNAHTSKHVQQKKHKNQGELGFLERMPGF